MAFFWYQTPNFSIQMCPKWVFFNRIIPVRNTKMPTVPVNVPNEQLAVSSALWIKRSLARVKSVAKFHPILIFCSFREYLDTFYQSQQFNEKRARLTSKVCIGKEIYHNQNTLSDRRDVIDDQTANGISSNKIENARSRKMIVLLLYVHRDALPLSDWVEIRNPLLWLTCQ